MKTYKITMLAIVSAFLFALHPMARAPVWAQTPKPPKAIAPPPAAPSNLGWSTGSRGIVLSWRSNSTGDTRFDIERSTSTSVSRPPGPWSRVGQVFNRTDYEDTGVNAYNRTWYRYRVRAFDTSSSCDPSSPAFDPRRVCHSPYSNEISVTWDEAPAAPTNLTATAVSSRQIDLHWTDNSNNESAFIVSRALSNEPPPPSGRGPFDSEWSRIAQLPADTTSYSDTDVEGHGNYHHYYYRVVAKITWSGGNESTTASNTAHVLRR